MNRSNHKKWVLELILLVDILEGLSEKALVLVLFVNKNAKIQLLPFNSLKYRIDFVIINC